MGSFITTAHRASQKLWEEHSSQDPTNFSEVYSAHHLKPARKIRL
jgi:hypothetical protein